MILKFILTSLVLAFMPGPDIIFVAAQSMVRGKRSGIAIALGLSSGLFVHTAAAAAGISLLIASSPYALTVIKYAGIAYLVYLGIGALLESRKEVASEETEETENDSTKSLWKLYRTGITMNLLNPKVIIFFLALFPQFIDKESNTPIADVFLLGTIFAAVSVTAFSAVAVLADFISAKFSIKNTSPKVMGWVKASTFWLIALIFFFY